MTKYAEDVRLTVYSDGVDQLGGAVDFTRRENVLSGLESLGGSRAKPLEARSETLRSKIRVVDDGSITGEIFDNSTNEPLILDRLFEVEIRWDGGSWQRVAAGRVIDVRQTEEVMEYEFQIADEGQLLRERSAFATDNAQPFGGGADTVSVLPRGVIEKWREFDAVTPIKYRVNGFRGSSNEAVEVTLGGDVDIGEEDWRKGPASLTDELQDLIINDIREDANPLTYSLEPAISEGHGEFQTLRFHDVGSDADKELFASGDLTGGFDVDGNFKKPQKRPLILWLYWPGNTLSEGDTGTCYLYMPGHKPTETLPLHFGGESGVDQWQHLKDGLDAAEVRYDTTAVNDLIGKGEKIWPRVTEDLTFLEHLKRTVLYPNGFMLAPNESGELTPVRIGITTPDEVPDINQVPVVDRDSIAGPDYPTWSHTREDQVTVLIFKCHVVTGPMSVPYVGPPVKGDPETIWPDSDGSADGLRESEFEIEKTHKVDTYGRREIEIHLSGLENRRAFDAVASALSEMIFTRWGGGSIMSQLGLLKGHEDLSPGDFVVIDLDHFPNPAVVGSRGGTLIVQPGGNP